MIILDSPYENIGQLRRRGKIKKGGKNREGRETKTFLLRRRKRSRTERWVMGENANIWYEK